MTDCSFDDSHRLWALTDHILALLLATGRKNTVIRAHAIRMRHARLVEEQLDEGLARLHALLEEIQA